MFRKILFPTDFSEVSAKALPYIKQLRQGGSEEVVLLHVIDVRGIEAVEQYSPETSLQVKERVVEQAREQLAAIEEELSGTGLRIKCRVEVGIPLQEVLRVEQEEDVSVVVIGSHGKSNMEEMLLGSVSEKVARKAKHPVLIVKR